MFSIRSLLLIFCLTLAAGSWLLLHPHRVTPSDLTVWVFARTHFQAYEPAVRRFETQHPGVHVKLELVHNLAINQRLLSAIWADLDVPDLVELNIDTVGQFFRGPVDRVGLADLGPWLRAQGYERDLPAARLAPYIYHGKTLGIPHDIHPVMLAYRRDIFEQFKIDPASLDTWNDFIRAGRRITKPGARYMLELSDNNVAHFEIVLFQRGGGYFSADGQLRIQDELFIDTLKWYIPLVAGPDRIGSETGAGIGMGHLFTQSVENDYLVSFLCPDWRTRFIEVDAPRMAGKMELMPLPRFPGETRHTSTMGGTMLAMTSKARNRELAFELIRALYFDFDGLRRNFAATHILPSYLPALNSSEFMQPNPYWNQQPLGQLYTRLVPDVPPQYTHPFTSIVKIKMGGLLASSSAYYRTHGNTGFDAFVRQGLAEATHDLQRQMERNPI